MRLEKVIGNVGGAPAANTLYLVRTGAGFDALVTDATGATAHTLNPTLTWGYLLLHWSAEPALVAALSDGEVYSYMLDGTTRYRFVPNEGVATPDAFYGAFVANVLSDLIAVKG